MKFYVLTLFPEMFSPVLEASVLGKAHKEGFISTTVLDIRDFTHDIHRTVDDYPYGGGPGMVLKPEPVYEAVEHIRSELKEHPTVALLSPQGRKFDSCLAKQLAAKSCLVLVAGHYEGFDERIRALADIEISVGDFVLTGGEIPAMLVLDAVGRFVEGVLGSDQSAGQDSFSEGLLEGPQYTRPREYRGMRVPEVLLSGDHRAIGRWRKKESLRRTFLRRRELLDSACLTFQDMVLLEEVKKEEGTRHDHAFRSENDGCNQPY